MADACSRLPSHDYGMVGLIKRLIDHVAGPSIQNVTPTAVGHVLPVDSMTVRQGMVVLRRRDPADR